MTDAITLVIVPGNDTIEAWATHGETHRPYLVQGDAVENAVSRMLDSDEYDVDFVDLDCAWSVSVQRRGCWYDQDL